MDQVDLESSMLFTNQAMVACNDRRFYPAVERLREKTKT
jgi:hypothetical protein